MDEKKIKRRRNAALLLLLLCMALAGPAGLSTLLLHAASAPVPLPTPVGNPQAVAPAAGLSPAESDARAKGTPLISGMLYTSGPVQLNWSGLRIPVDNSSYAYTGGELISTPPNAMGILKLDGGASVFICPGSRVRLSRDASGQTLIEVVAGSSRFMFEEDASFKVRVNNTVMGPASDGGDDPPSGHAYTGEAVASEEGGCLICNLNNSLVVDVELGNTKTNVIAKGGQIVSVGGPGSLNPISSVQLPGELLAGMRAGMASKGARGLGYLCKCKELGDYAARTGDHLAGQPTLDLVIDLANSGTDLHGSPGDASSEPARLPDARPAVAPPPVPDITVSESLELGPFVPGPLPGAGEEQPRGGYDVVVPPPLVPGWGPGGGGIVSSS